MIRASLGTVFTQPVVQLDNEEALKFLKDQGARIYAALPEAKENYTHIDWSRAAALVVGTEKEGLSGFWENKADAAVRIPMRGKADSLNVSVSTAILLYESVRQRS